MIKNPAEQILFPELVGKTVLITGASRGIGKQIAIAFARNASNVVLVARSASNLKEICEEIKQEGGNATYFSADFSSLDAAIQVLNFCGTQNIQPDVIINTLGGVFGSKTWGDPEEFERLYRLNFISAYSITKEFLPILKEKVWARLIYFGTVSTENGLNSMPYVVSKAALDSFVKFASRELAKLNPGIVSTMIRPGPIKVPGKYLSKLSVTNKTALDAWLLENNVSAGRLGEMNEIADLALFLASDKASFMHGSIIDINGGSF
jgi:3-oxoacyl-[acyl-carrier protein] reductase